MKNEYLICEDCGKQDETVYETISPYAKEINEQIIEITICPECYHERCMNI